MKYELFEVGGRVRDKFLGVESKDIDYTVVLDFDELDILKVKLHDEFTDLSIFKRFVKQLKSEGFEVFLETPECFTVRAMFPKDHKHSGVADFVIARKELGYAEDTRKPISTFGVLADDLIRRDFTVNAMAETAQGDIIDLFDGMSHLRNGLLRTPIDSVVSFNQDPLRILRAFRFAITKGLNFSDDIATAIKLFQPEKMSVVSCERIREELTKMFKHDTLLTLRYLRWLEDMNPRLHRHVLSGGMWLNPTTKQ